MQPYVASHVDTRAYFNPPALSLLKEWTALLSLQACLLSPHSVKLKSDFSWIKPPFPSGFYLRSEDRKVIAPRIGLSVSNSLFAGFLWWRSLPWLLYYTCLLLMPSVLIISWHRSWSTEISFSIILLRACLFDLWPLLRWAQLLRCLLLILLFTTTSHRLSSPNMLSLLIRFIFNN